jgi:hypothetical protein
MYRALLGENAGDDLGAEFAVQLNTLSQVIHQSVLLLENQQGTCLLTGQLEDRPLHLGEVNSPRFIGSTQKKSDWISLNQYLTNFVPEDHHDDKHSNSTNTLEKPAGENQPTGLGNGVTKPKGKQTHQDLQGRGATKQEKESVDEKTDYQNVCHILPFEGGKEIHAG